MTEKSYQGPLRNNHATVCFSPASTDTTLAAVAVLNMDDAGEVAPAAAMAVLIFATTAVVRLLYTVITRSMLKQTQLWRQHIDGGAVRST